MKRIFFLLALGFSLNQLSAQSYDLKVLSGHGSGMYTVGDTVHIWAETPMDTSMIFAKWIGDVTDILREDEWHTQIVMPDRDIDVQVQFKRMPDHKISLEHIQAAEIVKPVYYFILAWDWW